MALYFEKNSKSGLQRKGQLSQSRSLDLWVYTGVNPIGCLLIVISKNLLAECLCSQYALSTSDDNER